MFFFLYIYIYSLEDKLLISPKIVCCDMIPNLGGGKGGAKLVDRLVDPWLQGTFIMLFCHF